MEIQENISLKSYTTFEIGGSARYFVTAHSSDDIVEAVNFAKSEGCPYYILGGGSNILFSDKGFDGVVIHIVFDDVRISDQRVTVGAGHNLLKFLQVVATAGLGGLEKMAGIPGTVGGAVRGNAGAFGTEIMDVVESVRVLDLKTEKVEDFPVDSCAFGYRQSHFKSHPNLVVLEMTCVLAIGNPETITSEMNSTIAERESRHIQNIRSAGSFFINPEVSEEIQQKFLDDKGVVARESRVPAGWLLDLVSMGNKRIGDVQAGETHANYFINVGDGTADHVIQLASLAKTRVRDQYDVRLREEVQLVGF